jgi:hypothetical protein
MTLINHGMTQLIKSTAGNSLLAKAVVSYFYESEVLN